MTRPRLRTRLTVWFAASVLLILFPFLCGILVLEWRSMRAALDHHITEDLEVASQLLVSKGPAVDWRTQGNHDPGYDAGSQRWVEVYRGGQPVFLRGVPRAEAIRAALGAPSPETLGYRTVRTPAGAYVRTLTVERMLGSGPVQVRVARSEDPLRRDLRQLVLLFATGAPLAVLAAAIAGFVISGWALAPLARMADRARSIGADDLSRRLQVENPDDELGQLAVVFNDTFARLEASFDRLKQFTGDASHELRTPLTAIRSVGEVGLREATDARGYRDVIGSMLEEADRLTTVVDTLLTFSRWDSGRVRPNLQPIDLRAIAEQAAGKLAVLAEDGGVVVELAIDRPLAASGDPVMIRQAVTNVLDNAIKFTPSGGRVRVSAESTPSEHRLVIDDEGPGIPIDHRQRVLERFYRIEPGNDCQRGGAGLGLAIVHRAMSVNHGRVTIDSNDAGGTRVTLSLPREGRASRT